MYIINYSHHVDQNDKIVIIVFKKYLNIYLCIGVGVLLWTSHYS